MYTPHLQSFISRLDQMYECHKGNQCVHSFPQVVQFQMTVLVNLREVQKVLLFSGDQAYYTCLSAKVFPDRSRKLWYPKHVNTSVRDLGLTWGMQGRVGEGSSVQKISQVTKGDTFGFLC